MEVSNPVLSGVRESVNGKGPADSRNSDEIQDRFMTLLITQIKNQDPLNPLDNSEVTSQLAQLNTVSGIERLNDTFSSMAASFTAGQTLQAAALVGRGVLVGWGVGIRAILSPVEVAWISTATTLVGETDAVTATSS